MVSSGPEADLETPQPALGDPVWTVGSPAGNRGNVTQGTLSNKVFRSGQIVGYRLDLSVFPGNSGGGVFNEHGKLLGIVTSFEIHVGFGIIPGGSHALSWDIIRKYLEKELPSIEPK